METPATHAAGSDCGEAHRSAEAGGARLVPKVLSKAFRLLASYGFSCLILFFLFVLTLLGTLDQVDNGIYAAQKRYFESLVVLQKFGPLPLPLPGGMLLLTLLFLNLLCGAILRSRKGWSRIGILTAHAGILMLLGGAFITYRFAQGGQMVLHEGEQSGVFESPDEWELAVTSLNATGAARQSVVALHDLESAGEAASLIITTEALPFDLDVSGYAPNAIPKPAAPGTPVGVKVVDGYALRAEAPLADAERNAPGAYITVRDRRSGASREGIVWAGEKAPWMVEIGDGMWSIGLRRRQWVLPFTLVLDKFSRELHPRTAMAKAYASEVTKIEGGARQAVRISMNEPLRSDGYTIYQASWGPQDAAPGSRVYSVFAVSRDPAERFPLYACVIITCGMALHFALRLIGHLRHEGARKS